MRNAKRILSLLLIVLLIVMILPTSASAELPQNDPSHKHQWKLVHEEQATCEQEGYRLWKCNKCGRTYKERTRRALGHDWDEGVVTQEPTLFNPGVRTFTCKRDPHHIRTESIDPLISSLKVVTHNKKPLVITEQPVDGAVTRYGGDTHHLHVAASGGEGSYTYEWFSRPVILSAWLGGAWSWTHIRSYGEQTEPDLETDEGGRRYWCVVSDEADNTASSNTVTVDYKLSIGKQPDDVNLRLDNPTLYCEAIDGSGDYTYRWFDSEMGILGEGQSFPATEPGICYCYCIVTDNVTGDTTTSEYCEVYDEEPFKLVSIGVTAKEMWPEEVGNLTAVFTGGTPDYEVWWEKDGEAIDTRKGVALNGQFSFYADSTGAGTYTVHGADAHGETASGSTVRKDKQLEIAKQPVGGIIPGKAYLPVSVEMKNGSAPFTFVLFRNGKRYDSLKRESYTGEFNIWYPGEYYIHIEDSKGHSKDSDMFTCNKDELRLKSQTGSATITYNGGGTTLAVEAEGGLRPYSYQWSVKKGSDWYNTGDDSPTLTAYMPGDYYCQVIDAEKSYVFSHTIPVTYTGNSPLIIQQPKNVITPNVPDGAFNVTLSCQAISGTGDDSGLQYYWEVQLSNGGSRHWALLKDKGPSINVSHLGLYRCRVIDNATGLYTYSDAVYVCGPLVCSYAQPWKGSNSFMYFYRCCFSGGVGPYKVLVYAADAERTPHYKVRLDEKRTVESEADLYLMKFLTFKYVKAWIDDPEDTFDLKVGCIVVVRDAIGQECESPYMEWK